MPKINSGGYSFSTPSIATPEVRDRSIPVSSPSNAQPQRAFEGEGIEYLTSGMRVLARGISNVGEAIAVHESEMTKVQASDYSATLMDSLNQRYLDTIAPLKSSAAKDVFKNEVMNIQKGKDEFLQQAGGNKRLRNMMSLEYDRISRAYLNNVLQHKLTQDEVYRTDTQYKTASALQSNASIYGLDNIAKIFDVSKEIDAKLSANPQLRELSKHALWQEYFKTNARKNPELAQKTYEDKTIKKNIIKEIGAEGYSSIQEQIDKGKSIAEHDTALAKQRAKDAKKEHDEKLMLDAYHLYFTNKLTTSYVDSLDVSSADKNTLDSLLIREATKGNKIEVDWQTYGKLSEEVNQYDPQSKDAQKVYREIINEIGKTITKEQGQTLIQTFSKRDVLKNPVTIDAYKQLESMWKNGSFENYSDYAKSVNDLRINILKNNGDPDKVLKFMHDILMPPIRRNAIRISLERMGLLKSSGPEYVKQGTATGPYLLEGEEDTMNSLLEKQKVKDKKGNIITYDMLNDRAKRKMLDYIRSDEYLKIKEK